MVSVRPDQRSSRCQQPARGTSTMDGPGPPATSRVTRVVVPSRVAVMTRVVDALGSGDGVAAGRETQRILLVGPSVRPTVRGWPNSTATISPFAPNTCGARASPLKPASAQSGSRPSSTRAAQPVGALAAGVAGVAG